MHPTTLYVTLSFISSLVFALIFTVNQIYYVTVVEMTPLQLVLMGTILEVSIFLFEVPTGVVADVKSRRLSVIVGYFIMGAGFLVEGALPIVWSIALAQVLWGLGYTFTSGASEAWIADEVGEARAGDAYLRASQWSSAGGLIAIPVSVLLGNQRINLPILVGGAALVGIGLFLALTMREEGFTPTPPGERSSWRQMADTLHQARRLVQRQPVLLSLLGIGFFYGLYSEGLDRLSTPHLIQNFTFPAQGRVSTVTWFGIISAVGLALNIVSTHFVRRRTDVTDPYPIGRLSRLIGALIVVALLGFALTHSFWLALAFLWCIGALRNAHYPLQTAWVNLKIDDPQVRATLISVSSQTDAIGQIAGGPLVGVIGNLSIRAALTVSALLLSPVLPLYRRALRKEQGALDGAETT